MLNTGGQTTATAGPTSPLVTIVVSDAPTPSPTTQSRPRTTPTTASINQVTTVTTTEKSNDGRPTDTTPGGVSQRTTTAVLNNGGASNGRNAPSESNVDDGVALAIVLGSIGGFLVLLIVAIFAYIVVQRKKRHEDASSPSGATATPIDQQIKPVYSGNNVVGGSNANSTQLSEGTMLQPVVGAYRTDELSHIPQEAPEQERYQDEKFPLSSGAIDATDEGYADASQFMQTSSASSLPPSDAGYSDITKYRSKQTAPMTAVSSSSTIDIPLPDTVKSDW